MPEAHRSHLCSDLLCTPSVHTFYSHLLFTPPRPQIEAPANALVPGVYLFTATVSGGGQQAEDTVIITVTAAAAVDLDVLINSGCPTTTSGKLNPSAGRVPFAGAVTVAGSSTISPAALRCEEKV